MTRTLALLTDAFGGHGGIAQYNRDLLSAVCLHPACKEVIALPRLMHHGADPIPSKLTHVLAGLGGRIRYVLALFKVLFQAGKVDVVLCCHINLLPLAWLASRIKSAPLVLTVFGIDAWQPTPSRLANRLASRVDRCIAISRFTRRRFLSWALFDPSRCQLLPNAIDLGQYGIRPKRSDLLQKHGLAGRTIVMTFGRLAAAERYKGFDEILDVLPELVARTPKLAYLIVGDGDDRQRLEGRVQSLGLHDHVRFTGRIAESDKADYYALADVYAMPSRGEGLGFVFLEAMASGIPAIASSVDGSRDAAADGVLASLVDPARSSELVQAIEQAFAEPRRIKPELSRFCYPNFVSYAHRILDEACQKLH